MIKRYEQFSHTADIGVRVFGRDLKELFENAAFSLFDTTCDLDGIKGSIEEGFSLEAPSDEELLVAWLDELLYYFYTKEIIFFKFHVEKIEGHQLIAKAFGRLAKANKNRLKIEIKAATYHNLHIKRTADGLTVEMILDV